MKTKQIISNHTNELITINVTEKCKHYMKDGATYSSYIDCTKCKNAS